MPDILGLCWAESCRWADAATVPAISRPSRLRRPEIPDSYSPRSRRRVAREERTRRLEMPGPRVARIGPQVRWCPLLLAATAEDARCREINEFHARSQRTLIHTRPTDFLRR